MNRKTKFTICRNGFLKGFFTAMAVTYLFYQSMAISVPVSFVYGLYGIFREKKEYRKSQNYEITLEVRLLNMSEPTRPPERGFGR